MPLADATLVPTSLISNDWSDIALIEIDMATALKGFARNARLVDLDTFFDDWEPFAEVADFAAIGFPSERSSIDFEKRTVTTGRTILQGQYAGPAGQHRCHYMTVNDGLGLSTWQGMSGGPVFAWVRRLGLPSQLFLAGIAIQGTPTFGMITFIEARIIRSALAVW